MSTYCKYQLDGVRRLAETVFRSYGYTEDESAFITDVLLAADLYGIESHGVNRLALYTYGIDIGRIKLGVKPEIVRETPLSVTIDAHDGEGHIASRLGMEQAIEKAKQHGVGMAVVRRSNHFGIAGYYTRMALPHGMMGMCLTNAEALMVPTFGKQPMMGTDPIAVSMPAKPIPYTLDMATTVVPGGKLEVYAKNGAPLPEGWIVDPEGESSNSAKTYTRIRDEKTTGGILPLGGIGEVHGGHKGYGLAVLVELMTGSFALGNNSDFVRRVKNEEKCCHFFMALDYGMFGDKDEIEGHFSDYLGRIRASPKAKGQARIYTHGEKEAENEARVRREGVAINTPTLEEIRKLSEKKGIPYQEYLMEV